MARDDRRFNMKRKVEMRLLCKKVISVNYIPRLPPLTTQRRRREEKEAAGGINYLACPPQCWRGLLCRAVMEMTKVSYGKWVRGARHRVELDWLLW